MKANIDGWQDARIGWVTAEALAQVIAHDPEARILVVLPPVPLSGLPSNCGPEASGPDTPPPAAGVCGSVGPIPPAEERSRCSKNHEAKLMERLRVLFQTRSERAEGGKRCEEMDRSGGHWRKDWVRPHPDLVMRGILVLEEEIRAGNDKDNRAAWMQRVLTNWRKGEKGEAT